MTRRKESSTKPKPLPSYFIGPSHIFICDAIVPSYARCIELCYHRPNFSICHNNDSAQPTEATPLSSDTLEHPAEQALTFYPQLHFQTPLYLPHLTECQLPLPACPALYGPEPAANVWNHRYHRLHIQKESRPHSDDG